MCWFKSARMRETGAQGASLQTGDSKRRHLLHCSSIAAMAPPSRDCCAVDSRQTVARICAVSFALYTSGCSYSLPLRTVMGAAPCMSEMCSVASIYEQDVQRQARLMACWFCCCTSINSNDGSGGVTQATLLISQVARRSQRHACVAEAPTCKIEWTLVINDMRVVLLPWGCAGQMARLPAS